MYSEPLPEWNPRMLKGKGLQRALQGGDEEVLAENALDGNHDLELGDAIDQVDDVQPVDAIPVALMDRVHALVAGCAAGLRSSALAARHTA